MVCCLVLSLWSCSAITLFSTSSLLCSLTFVSLSLVFLLTSSCHHLFLPLCSSPSLFVDLHPRISTFFLFFFLSLFFSYFLSFFLSFLLACLLPSFLSTLFVTISLEIRLYEIPLTTVVKTLTFRIIWQSHDTIECQHVIICRRSAGFCGT